MVAAFCLWFGLACAYVERDMPVPTHAPTADAAVMSAAPMASAKMSSGSMAEASMFPVDCKAQPPDNLKNDFMAASRRHGIDPCHLAKQTERESAFDVKAVSPVGAEGVSQFMPATSRELGVDPWDPRQAIIGQAYYLGWCEARWTPGLAGRTTYDIEALGLACYNWGLGNMYENQRQHGWILYADAVVYFPAETQVYVHDIAGPEM